MTFLRVEVKGLRELGEALKALPAEIASKGGGPLSRALRASANVIRDEARTLAPVDLIDDDGVHLRDSIKVQRDPKPGNVTERMVVKVRFKRGDKVPRNYMRFLEFGTELQPAQPFLRPAFDAKKDEALQVFVGQLSKGIAAAARKVARSKGQFRGR